MTKMERKLLLVMAMVLETVVQDPSSRALMRKTLSEFQEETQQIQRQEEIKSSPEEG